MNGSPRFTAPPGMATVHRATLDALAQYGPRRVGVTHIARLADTNRAFIYRNWPDPRVLIRDATLGELKHLLNVARDVPEPVPPPGCLAVHMVVRAARLLREHPVVGALARIEPTHAHMAVLRPNTVWHNTAWHWLTEYVTAHLRLGPEQDTATLAVLTTALPYALTPPPESCDLSPERASVDRRLTASLHPCLGLPAGCSLCTEQPTPH
ncbi:MAG: TetR/AcrR family transcriptional regulator [Streptomyces sp.]|nr:TetR/AcrR family transcriptional regulator [Streptomyces sp.]